jgi:protein SCO1/2
MAPNGNFVDAFGKIFSKDEVYIKVHSYMTEWARGKRYGEEDV